MSNTLPEKTNVVSRLLSVLVAIVAGIAAYTFQIVCAFFVSARMLMQINGRNESFSAFFEREVVNQFADILSFFKIAFVAPVSYISKQSDFLSSNDPISPAKIELYHQDGVFPDFLIFIALSGIAFIASYFLIKLFAYIFSAERNDFGKFSRSAFLHILFQVLLYIFMFLHLFHKRYSLVRSFPLIQLW